MLKKLVAIFETGFNAENIVKALNLILGAIFGYIEKEEGYVEAE